jgi:hypothetical protein
MGDGDDHELVLAVDQQRQILSIRRRFGDQPAWERFVRTIVPSESR